jgi:hypothetical protein
MYGSQDVCEGRILRDKMKRSGSYFMEGGEYFVEGNYL